MKKKPSGKKLTQDAKKKNITNLPKFVTDAMTKKKK